MIGVCAAAGVLALCVIIIPLTGWWLAGRLSSYPFERFTAACLVGVTTLAAAQLIPYALGMPQWLTILMLVAVWTCSLPPLITAVRRRWLAWDAWLLWTGISAILISATVGYAVHGANGGVWDWYEHWLRARVFLAHAPVTSEIGIYNIPARGPLFNAAAAA